MEVEAAPVKWRQSILYLASIFVILYLLRTRISHNLLINHHAVRHKKSSDLPLRFRYDGTFKILQVADMHYGMGLITRCRDVSDSEFKRCSDLNTTRFLRMMIEAEKPDLIAFTGDNIFGSSTVDAAESLLQAISPAIESGVPWAAVLGNHDQESTMTRGELMSFLSLMDYSVSQTNPVPVRKIDGFGNYDLKVHGAPGSKLANSSVLNLYFLDSGDRETVNGTRTYGWIKESQLSWLRMVSEQQQVHEGAGDQFAGSLVARKPPALAFFHIPIPEVRELWYGKIIGHFQEGVACSRVSSGVLNTFVSMGDVKAAFIGHDHTNDFCGNLRGIWLCYGGGFGYHGYGKAGQPRRARIILAELEKDGNTWGGVERVKTWKRLDDGTLSKVHEHSLWEKMKPPH